MKRKSKIITAAVITFMATGNAGAQDAKAPSLDDMNFLLGDWEVETKYANGNRAIGTRTCAYVLGETYVKCTSDTQFDNGPTRRIETYVNYNKVAKSFEEVTIYQFPPGKKLADINLSDDGETLFSRGYIYGGDGKSGPRVSEAWQINATTISIDVRLNRSAQPAHEWPIFITETMTKKN